MGEHNEEKDAGLGDGQGTKIAAPDQHSDKPSPRPEKSMGTGHEATIVDPDASEHDREHRSGYGGKGGQPVTSSDKREKH